MSELIKTFVQDEQNVWSYKDGIDLASHVMGLNDRQDTLLNWLITNGYTNPKAEFTNHISPVKTFAVVQLRNRETDKSELLNLTLQEYTMLMVLYGRNCLNPAIEVSTLSFPEQG